MHSWATAGLLSPAQPRPELQQLLFGLDPQRLGGAADRRHPRAVPGRRFDDEGEPEVEQLVRGVRQELVQDHRRRDRERPRGGQGDELCLVLHRLDEPGVRDDEAEALGQPLPVLGDEDHRLVGAEHQHRRGRLPPGELDEAVRQGLVVPLRGLHPVPRHDVVGVAGPAGGVAGRGDHPDRYVRHRQRPHDLDDARTQHDGHRPTLGHAHRTHPSRAVEASSAQVLSTRLLPLRIGEANSEWHQKRQAGHSSSRLRLRSSVDPGVDPTDPFRSETGLDVTRAVGQIRRTRVAVSRAPVGREATVVQRAPGRSAGARRASVCPRRRTIYRAGGPWYPSRADG